MRNAEVLNAIANDDFQTELGQFNIEINVRPRSLVGTAVAELEAELRASLNDAEERSRAIGAHIVMIGMLPTLTPEHLTGDSLSANPRYKLINEQIFAARGEDLHIAIEGVERLSTHADTIAPEAACTSVQFHLQVSPQDYAPNWNAAQCLAGVQLALGANSPFLFGKELWRETRVALFEQATDTRPEELKAQGVRPRVWFGERWITSIFDQFEENVRYFPALLPVCDDEDPVQVLGTGRHAALGGAAHAQRHHLPVEPSGVRRVPGKPHLRVENRVLPAGPTVVDVLANGSVLLRPTANALPSRTGRCGRGCLSGRRGQLRRRAPGTASTPDLLAGRRRGAGDRAGAAPAAAVGASGAWPRGASTHRSVIGCSASSRDAASTHVNGAEWQARDLPPDRRGDAAARPARRAAGDAAPLRRAHAQQRAGAHLAADLTDGPLTGPAPIGRVRFVHLVANDLARCREPS